MTLPLLTLAPNKYSPGRDKAVAEGLLSGELTAGPASEVLAYPFTTDAHCVQYACPSDRHRPTIRAICTADGAPTVMLWLIVDLDAPEHSKGFASAGAEALWRAQFDAALCRVWARYPGFATYNTRGGGRLLWRLARPFEVQSTAERHRWGALYCASLRAIAAAIASPDASPDSGLGAELAERLSAAALDAKVHDFTRWFRLPNVNREGVGPVSSAVGGDLTQGAWDLDAPEVLALIAAPSGVRSLVPSGVPSAARGVHGTPDWLGGRDRAAGAGGGSEFDWTPYRCPAGTAPADWFEVLCRTRWEPNGGTNLLRLGMAARALGVDPFDATELAWSDYAPRCSPAWDFDEFSRKFTEATTTDHLPRLLPSAEAVRQAQGSAHAAAIAQAKASLSAARASLATAKANERVNPSGATQDAVRVARGQVDQADAGHKNALAAKLQWDATEAADLSSLDDNASSDAYVPAAADGGVPRVSEGGGGLEALATLNPMRLRFTDIGLAEVMAFAFGDRLRYCEERKGWYAWNGRYWSIYSGAAQATQYCGEMIRELQRLLIDKVPDPDVRRKQLAAAIGCESSAKIAGILTHLKSYGSMRVPVTDLDAHPALLNCANGVVNLETGELTPHDSRLMMTRSTGVNYRADAVSPLWGNYVWTLVGGNGPGGQGWADSPGGVMPRDRWNEAAELFEYLQRAAGCSLWGYSVEKAFFFLYGARNSGKSRFLDGLRVALGTYATSASFSTWQRQSSVGGNRGDLVDLVGTRVVVSSEVSPDARLDVEMVKSVTGGDTIKAAAKFEKDIEIRPTFTLWWAANDRPRARADDSGFWGRARVIPCNAALPEGMQDRELAARFAAPEHAEAILAWCVAGCIKWRAGLNGPTRQGLGRSVAVDREIEAYHASQDPTAGFWEACLARVAVDGDAKPAPGVNFISRAELCTLWESWAVDNCSPDAAKSVSRRRLFVELSRRIPGALDAKAGGGLRGYIGVTKRKESA